MSQSPSAPTQYLLFSDVHLGADLVQHTRPWTAERLARVLDLDHELSAMLEHYRREADPDCPWTLIIAGDLVDFMGMSISPGDALTRTPLTAEEHAHGLGTADDHAAYKMRAVADRHRLVFESLAAFVADGHSLVLVRGNHDVEFYWEGPRRAFVDALLSHVGERVRDEVERERFEQRVSFRHWFYYVEGLLYVEHGHQYDTACCYPNVLSPLSPRDPRRLWYSFSDILLRFVVRPTRGLSSEGHERADMLYYLKLAFSLGARGCAKLGQRFFRAVFEMLRNWRDHVSPRARELRAEHDSRLLPTAQRLRLSVDKLRALAGLWARPVTGDLRAILRGVFLDLLAVIGLSTMTLVVLFLLGIVPSVWLSLIALGMAFGIYRWMKGPRAFDPREALHEGARRVAELLPARFVVMGHTHEPRYEALSETTSYINLGGWAVDDLDRAEGAVSRPAPCTHLVIRDVAGEPRAELRHWRSEVGPRPVSRPPRSGVPAAVDGADGSSTCAA